MKSKIIAGLAALFLGGIGLHKAYLGQKDYFVLYVIFCWTLIPAIVSFFEGIRLLLMSQKKFDEKYNTIKA